MSKYTDRTDHHCGVCETPVFERNRYFTGKLMVPRDFLAEQAYVNEKRRLINRSVLGWGVVCGLDVVQRREDGPLVVEPGLALDCCGHEILVCEEACVSLDELARHCPDRQRGRRHRLVICLEYEECETEPVVDPAASDCEGERPSRYNRVRDSYRLRLRTWDDLCLEREPECYLDHVKQRAGRERDCRTPGLHDHLCDRSKRCPECRSCECIALAVLDVSYPGDPEGPSPEKRHEVRQAEPEQERPKSPDDDCGQPHRPRIEIDTCTYRRLVYPNPVLHELIACFHPDPPRIARVRWRQSIDGHGVEWSAFAALIQGGGISVAFDQPMDPDSLHHRSFTVTALIRESGTGYVVRKYVPCREIEYRPDDEQGCYWATFHPEADWVRDELEGRHSELAEGVDVEIILRGSLITSETGRALDGEYIGGRLPTGNGVQAGDFIDWFAVGPREEAGHRGKGEEEADAELIENF